jgi:2,4'-dihydroxyacetophenone dioxygenase
MSALRRAEMAIVEEYAADDRYISERELPWFPWVGDIEIKVLRADNRNGQFVLGLRSAVDAVLGKHRHRGTVTAVILRGRFEYFEYDWIASPGDYVRENPGAIHTLHIFEDSEIVFTIDGSIEFLNDDETLNNTMDMWSFVHLYAKFCEGNGIELNKRIFY